MFDWAEIKEFFKRKCRIENDHWLFGGTSTQAYSFPEFAQPSTTKSVAAAHHSIRMWMAMANCGEYFDIQSHRSDLTCDQPACVNHVINRRMNVTSVEEFDQFRHMAEWDRFQLNCRPPDSKTQCVFWKGPVDELKYGKVSFCGKVRRAHVVAWELLNGKDAPKGKVIRHLCGNKLCVQGLHLEPGTALENAADEDRLGKRQLGEKCSHAKMTNQTARAIVASRGNGKTAVERAKEFGVSAEIIRGIDNGRQWRHLMTVEEQKYRQAQPPKTSKSGLTRDEIRICKAFEGVRSSRERATMFGVSLKTINNMDLGKLGKNILLDEKADLLQQKKEELDRVTSGRKKAHMDADTVRKLKESKDTLSVRERSVMFGITPGAVRNIDSGKYHTNVLVDLKEQAAQTKKAEDKRISEGFVRAMNSIRKRSVVWKSPDGVQHLLWRGNQTTAECPRPTSKLFGKSEGVHRISWKCHNKQLDTPADKPCVLHSCLYKFCVEPTHLRAGTSGDNAHDRFRDGTTASNLSEDNVRTILSLNYSNGPTSEELAAVYGLTPLSIRRIWAGQTWAHLHNESKSLVRNSDQKSSITASDGSRASDTTQNETESTEDDDLDTSADELQSKRRKSLLGSSSDDE